MSRLPLVLICCLTALVGCGLNSEPAVLTLQGRWWSWAATEPSETNPIADQTGELCDLNQPTDVWFLAGTFGGSADRRCLVPQGRPIVAPIVNMYSGDEQDCAAFMRRAEGSARLNGAELPVERIDRQAIIVTAASGNALGESPGTFRAIGCGLWAHIAPLTPGSHSLQIRGQSGDFTVAVNYTLEVSAGQASPQPTAAST